MYDLSKSATNAPKTRREMIFGIGLAAAATGLAAVSLSATAARAGQMKMSPGDIGYQSHPNGTQRCELCVNWQGPSACKVVSGPISANGWCGIYARKS